MLNLQFYRKESVGMAIKNSNSEHTQENTPQDKKDVSFPHEYCSPPDTAYSIIHTLRDISSPEHPASIADIQNSLIPRRAQHPAQTPSDSTLRRKISHSVEVYRKFLSPAYGRQNSDSQSVISTNDEMFAYKNLLPFQIMKGFGPKSSSGKAT